MTILDLIDNAIASHESPDAMRWAPDRPAITPEQARAAALNRIFADFRTAASECRQVISRVAEQLKPAFERLRQVDLAAEAERRARLSRMHSAYRRRHR